MVLELYWNTFLRFNLIEKYNKKYGVIITSISRTAMELLTGYNWPGNIRDLENAVQSAMILTKDNILQADHLPLRLRGY